MTASNSFYLSNQLLNFNGVKGLTVLDQNGDLVKTETIEPNNNWINYDHYYNDTYDYYVNTDYSSSKFLRKSQTEDSYNITGTESIINNKRGSIVNLGFLKVNNDKDIYNLVKVANYVPSYFGQELNVNSFFGESILSKISKDGGLKWKLSFDNFTNAYTTINDAEELITISLCNRDTTCRMKTEYQGNYTYQGVNAVSKTDKNGNVLWDKMLSVRANSPWNISSLSQVERDGKIYIVGTANQPLKYDNLDIPETNYTSNYTFILVLNTNGDLIKTRVFNSFYISDKSFLVADDSAIYLFGTFISYGNNFTIDGISIPKYSARNLLMLKFDSNLNLVSGKNLNPNSLDYLTPLNIIKNNDSFLITSNSNSKIDFANNELNNPYDDPQNFISPSVNILTRISESGNVVWSVPIYSRGSPVNLYSNESLAIDEESDIYLISDLAGKVAVNNQEYLLHPDIMSRIVMKFNNSGLLKGFKQFPINNSYPETINTLHVVNENEIYLAGNILTTTESNKMDDFVINTHNGSNYYIAVLEKDYLQTIETKKESLVLYPNPSSDLVFIKDHKNYNQAKLYDATGKMVLESKSLEKGINISQLPNGIYYIELLGKERAVSKIIKK